MKFCKGEKTFKKSCPERMTCALYDNWIMRKILKQEAGVEKNYQGRNKCINYEML